MNQVLRKGMALLLWVASAAVCAQVTDVTPPTPAQSLACLQRDASAPKFPERNAIDHGWGLIRVLLRFDQPDAKPKVEILTNTAREDMQDEVLRYLSSYRLPCLKATEGVVSAVQEFNFNNSDRDPVPLEGEHRPPLCLVMPRQDLSTNYPRASEIQNLVLDIVFDGDGKKEPEARVVYSSGLREFEDDAVEFARQYRMPCRTGSEAPRIVRQSFSFVPYNATKYAFKREAFSLGEFLGLTQGIQAVDVDFDFKTMGCPFKVLYEAFGPHLPNEVTVSGKQDPNRAPFLRWLRERQIAFQSKKQARSLFGSLLQIDVPCTRLELHPEAARAATAASAAG